MVDWIDETELPSCVAILVVLNPQVPIRGKSSKVSISEPSTSPIIIASGIPMNRNCTLVDRKGAFFGSSISTDPTDL